ncbi:MAG: C1 family peptidase [Anaerolineaceae bacterium]|nr:C1 family peptidase [Anaerolineaceae bacterium]
MQRRGLLILGLFIFILIFPKTNSQANTKEFPSKYDWRDEGFNFPVLDQQVENCNSGYAFATVGAIQAAIWKKDKVTLEFLDFSENNAKECNWNAKNTYEGIDKYSCKGGNSRMLINLFTQEGLVKESCDPYISIDCDCNTSCTPEYFIKEWQQFRSGYPLASIDLIKQKLIEFGPLYSQMDSNISGFADYSGGFVLYDNSVNDPSKYTHGVLIVGWDDDLSHAGGKGAWIVKNSYGTDWGNQGYFTVAYGSAGIGSYLSTVTSWEKSSSFKKLYFYDEAGHTTQTSNGEFFEPNQVLALFTPEGDEIAQTVEFWSNDTATVNLQIYDQFSNGILSGLLYESLNIDVPFAGYYSIALSPNIEINNDDEIVVVLEIKNKSNLFPIAVDNLGILSEDRTWIKNDQGIWKSLPETMKFDAGIRLRTFVLPDGFNQRVFLPLIKR